MLARNSGNLKPQDGEQILKGTDKDLASNAASLMTGCQNSRRTASHRVAMLTWLS